MRANDSPAFQPLQDATLLQAAMVRMMQAVNDGTLGSDGATEVQGFVRTDATRAEAPAQTPYKRVRLTRVEDDE